MLQSPLQGKAMGVANIQAVEIEDVVAFRASCQGLV